VAGVKVTWLCPLLLLSVSSLSTAQTDKNLEGIYLGRLVDAKGKVVKSSNPAAEQINGNIRIYLLPGYKMLTTVSLPMPGDATKVKQIRFFGTWSRLKNSLTITTTESNAEKFPKPRIVSYDLDSKWMSFRSKGEPHWAFKLEGRA
jgi:hypothetical protein